MSEEAGKEVVNVTPLDTPAEEMAREEGAKETGEFEPLFPDEAEVTEESLKGIEDTPTGPKETPEEKALPKESSEGNPEDTAALKPEDDKTEEKQRDKPPEESKKEDEVKAVESEKKPGQDDAPDYSKPPPKGYVPLPALQETRQEIQTLKAQNAHMLQQLQMLQRQGLQPEKQEPSFKRLNDQEFDELLADDPDEALRYERNLRKYEKDEAEQRQIKMQEQAYYQQLEAAVEQSVQKMQQVVPGIFDQAGTVAKELSEFATSHGFHPDYLAALSNPGTRMQVPGSDQVFVLGEGAVSLVDMVNRLYKSSIDNDPKKLRSEIKTEMEKTLREEITKEVTASLMDKLKNDTSGNFRSIGTVPGSGENLAESKRVLSELDLARMTPEEERLYLGG